MRRALFAAALALALVVPVSAQECAQIDAAPLIEKLRSQGVIVLEGVRLETFLVELSEALQSPLKGVRAAAFDGHLLLFVLPDSTVCIGTPRPEAGPVLLKYFGGRNV